MPYRVDIDEQMIPEDEHERLVSLFGLQPNDDAAFENAIGKVVRAALSEYKEMMLGRATPMRANEIRERRLFHLIKYFFNGRIPTEAEVASMFQLTESESKSLVKNVRCRFRYELEREIRQTLVSILRSINRRPGVLKYKVTIHSEIVVEELNQLIGRIAPHLDPIVKSRGTVKQYDVTQDALEVLLQEFGLLPNAADEENAN